MDDIHKMQMTKKTLLSKIKLISALLVKLKELLALKKPVRRIIIHHTATNRDGTTWEAIERGHKDRWNFKSAMGMYMGYQYLITSDGKIHQSRLDTEEGAHTRGYNRNSIGISLTGNFEVDQPSTEQLESLDKLLHEKIESYGLKQSDIYGHKDLSRTVCPGNNLYNWIKDFKGLNN